LISLIGNRPALQIGSHQVLDYDTSWLDVALERAAAAAEHEDFPFIGEIRGGIVEYLESRCPLKLLALEELFDRVKRMLRAIGCERIAEHLKPVAPPLTVSLVATAMAAGNGFELAFFESLRGELEELRALGVEEIHFTGIRESARILRGTSRWNRQCEALLAEIEHFLRVWDHLSTSPARDSNAA
jgi:hypothetical protein